MNLLLLIIGLLPFIVNCCPSETRLRIDGDIYTQANGLNAYRVRCNKANSIMDFSVCVTQRNSLEPLLGCADVNKLWTVEVDKGSILDNDMRPFSPLYYSKIGPFVLEKFENDGLMDISARDVLRNVAHACIPYMKTNLEPIFLRCPFTDGQGFLSCLCCENVNNLQIKDLHTCLTKKLRPRWVRPEALEAQFDWVCQGTCISQNMPLKNPCPYHYSSIQRSGLRDSELGEVKQCITRRRNGVPVPLKRARPRAFSGDGMDDNEIDESDVDKSQFSDFFDFTYTYNMSLPTEASTEASTKTSKLPSTPHSHTTTSLPSDLAGLVASGTPSIFAVQETNQPSSLAGGDNVGNTGTGFKGTNHALLGLILAFVGILYHVV
jgi:hypothetical protein